MSYFKNFPKVDWNGYILNDLTFRVKMLDSVKFAASAYEYYAIKDGQSLEEIAYRLYDSPDYEWIIMLLNDIIDPIYDLPLNQEELLKFTINKYGNGNEYQPHHYTKDNRIFNVMQLGGAIVSNYEFEDAENEARRKIKLLKKEYLPRVISDFEKLLSEAKQDIIEII